MQSEKELLQLAAGGNELAFTRLFHGYKYKLYGFVFRLTGTHVSAEDIVQDIFEKLWKDRETLLQIDSFQSYIFRMAQNHAINGFKRMAREVTILKQLADAPAVPSSITPQGSLALKETQERLRNAIQQLPPQQKIVFLLSREQGVKHEEIARRLQITTGTVKNHMIQALRTLRKQMRHYPNSLDAIYFVMVLIMVWGT
ncbi:RNA polymerase sigma factor [Chitinophaga sp. GCM10012297]|uniref:RNA polymerase sigma-70 factor n=1 Tax=Chitinophaga chungangae TaxID=2821488 RepID=A0ABS3YC84_9BACT|nr:RNA polymerase sigma-70 factor [Chitinophaga chungangae]MBO9152297.1 RNA polymerase sigma-70 factor [Chitinophaga chungangae]